MLKMDLQENTMQLIVAAGNARSFAMEAIGKAKIGNIEEARELLNKALEEVNNAHKMQTRLIQEEAAGNKIELNLLMVHAQDHLMNAITVKDLASEFIDLYEKMK